MVSQSRWSERAVQRLETQPHGHCAILGGRPCHVLHLAREVDGGKSGGDGKAFFYFYFFIVLLFFTSSLIAFIFSCRIVLFLNAFNICRVSIFVHLLIFLHMSTNRNEKELD